MSFSMAMTARATNVVANSISREASGATVANGLATFADLLGRRCDAPSKRTLLTALVVPASWANIVRMPSRRSAWPP